MSDDANQKYRVTYAGHRAGKSWEAAKEMILRAQMPVKTIIVVAGSLAQFKTYTKQIRKNATWEPSNSPGKAIIGGNTYLYPSNPDRLKGIQADEFVFFGTWWERDDLEALRSLERLTKARKGAA